MTYLFENPIPMLMVGLVLLTFTSVFYYTTRSLGAFIGSVIIVVLTLCGLVLEQLVHTPTEMVEVAVSGICRAAENNDIKEVRSYLSPNATETRRLVDTLMPRIQVEKANIIGEMDITLDDARNPTRATARFTGFFYGKDKPSGAVGGDRFPVTVELVPGENHRWLIESFTSDKDFEKEAAKLTR